MTATAMICLLSDPMKKTESGVTGASSAKLAAPYPRTLIGFPSLTTATATPGMCWAFI